MTFKERDFHSVENALGYRFENRKLLVQALTHRSASQTISASYERMEFLGDAVLQLAVSTYLYKKFSQLPEGELAKIRSVLVRESTLAKTARQLTLNKFLLVGKGERDAQVHEQDSLLCDVLEAVYGAIYLDGGFRRAQKIVLSHLPEYDTEKIPFIDAKSTLQEYFQQVAKKPPVYKVLKETGPDHDKRFLIEVSFAGKTMGQGEGGSKKEAAQEAARQALADLNIYEDK